MFQNGEINLVDSFEEIIRCLKDFSFKAPSPNIQYESMEFLKKIAKLINDKPEVIHYNALIFILIVHYSLFPNFVLQLLASRGSG